MSLIIIFIYLFTDYFFLMALLHCCLFGPGLCEGDLHLNGSCMQFKKIKRQCNCNVTADVLSCDRPEWTCICSTCETFGQSEGRDVHFLFYNIWQRTFFRSLWFRLLSELGGASFSGWVEPLSRCARSGVTCDGCFQWQLKWVDDNVKVSRNSG